MHLKQGVLRRAPPSRGCWYHRGRRVTWAAGPGERNVRVHSGMYTVHTVLFQKLIGIHVVPLWHRYCLPHLLCTEIPATSKIHKSETNSYFGLDSDCALSSPSQLSVALLVAGEESGPNQTMLAPRGGKGRGGAQESKDKGTHHQETGPGTRPFIPSEQAQAALDHTCLSAVHRFHRAQHVAIDSIHPFRSVDCVRYDPLAGGRNRGAPRRHLTP